jgi:hypothetical protein
MKEKELLLKIVQNKAQGEIIKNDGSLKLKLNFEYVLYWTKDQEINIPETWSAVGHRVDPYARNFVDFTLDQVARVSKSTEDYFTIILK